MGKKVWSLILAVVSRDDDDYRDGEGGANLAKELAGKFDAFLPEGYSMVSRNLLLTKEGAASGNRQSRNAGSAPQSISLLQKSTTGDANTNVNNCLKEGCARTDY